MPTQRSFFVYEATLLVADAIRRAGSEDAAAIHQALKTTTMPSALGGSYKGDDHNHAHTPLQISGNAGRQAGRDRDGIAEELIGGQQYQRGAGCSLPKSLAVATL